MPWEIRQNSIKRLSREEGAIVKDWGGRLPIALVYPNSYYVGMSSLGFQTLYSQLNSHPDVVCERLFAPERGLETEGRSEWSGEERRRARQTSGVTGSNQLVSIESQRQLDEFPVVGFSLSFELDYFNVISILTTVGIPPLSADRDEEHPLLIAGGPSITANPEPLAQIFDCLVIGEIEPILPELVRVLKEGVTEEKYILKKELAKIPGVYVPDFHSADIEGTFPPIRRQWASNINEFATTSTVFTPDTELGDMFLMEIARGCSRGCRFCLAGYAYRPVRIRSVERLLQQAKEGLKYRDRIGLVSAAVSDYPDIDGLITGLRRLDAKISVSSLRIHPFSETLLDALLESGTKTITLAPEAGSEHLRQVIQKGINEDHVLSAVDAVASKGIRKLKLYFMLGLPSETDNDIQELAELVQASKNRMDTKLNGTSITVNITPFVPKAGTPFQWEPMAEARVIKDRLQFLKNSLRVKGIEVRSESVDWSIAQAVLARGDRKLSAVLANMTSFSASGFQRALKSQGFDIAQYAHRRWGYDEVLPWSIIDSGTGPALLKREHDRALEISSVE